MKTLLIIGLLFCVSVGMTDGQQGNWRELSGDMEERYPLDDWEYLEETEYIDLSTAFFLEAEGLPNLVETVVDSVWHELIPDSFLIDKWGNWIRHRYGWEDHTHHYLKLRINGEIYRIELIKEEENGE